jgi:hypothetical protein
MRVAWNYCLVPKSLKDSLGTSRFWHPILLQAAHRELHKLRSSLNATGKLREERGARRSDFVFEMLS